MDEIEYHLNITPCPEIKEGDVFTFEGKKYTIISINEDRMNMKEVK